MRFLLASVAGVALLAMVFAAPAGASRAQFALTGGVPLRAGGDIGLDATTGILVIEGPGSDLRLDAFGFQISPSAAPTPTVVLVEGQPAPAPLRLVPGADGVRAVVAGTRLHVDSRGPTPSAADVWEEANAQVSLLLSPLDVAHGTAAGKIVPAGTHEARARDASFSISPDRLLLLAGGIETTTGAVPTTMMVPPGGSLVVDLSGAQMSGTAATATLYAPDLLVHVDGLARFAWAEGRIEGDGDHGWIDDTVLLGGRYELRSLGVDLTRAPAVSWLGAGDVDFLHFGTPPAEPIVPAAMVAGAAGAAIVGVGLAMYHWPALRAAGAFLVAPFYARLRRDEVLDHAGRSLVYDRIRADPGVSADRLAAGVDFGWSTLAYHLRVLERTDLVVSVREGRHRRFFDREDGRFANGRKLAVAVLKNDHTLAVGRAICDCPGVTQKALSQRFGLSPSSIHWHVERLREVGLLEKRRDGHNVRYYPGPAWTGIEVPATDAVAMPAPPAAIAIP